MNFSLVGCFDWIEFEFELDWIGLDWIGLLNLQWLVAERDGIGSWQALHWWDFLGHR